MREVLIRDTLSGEPRPLEPRDPGRVGVYACGPTTYARIHVGNARPYVIFILLKRFLEHEGYEVDLVVNVTDVNDKIYAAAREADVPSERLAAEMTALYVEDTDRLGLGRPDHEPLASETMEEIVALIEALISGGHAYESGGDVYFRVRSFDEYGKLSNRRPEDMDQGEEAGTARLKEDPLDFALWKARKDDEDTAWDSPWGPGRPGWHIECSAMAEKLLGVDFAIHGGGSDLVFPHHENELAQSRGAGRRFARFWAHNGMLELAQEKMSKSLGNIVSLRDALDAYGREAILLLFLGAHYRSPVEYSDEAMRAATAEAERFRNYFRGDVGGGGESEWNRLVELLGDDFNTPAALALMHEWRSRDRGDDLLRALRLFGLDTLAAGAEVPEEVAALAERRREAREGGDFAEADRLREEIDAAGWEVRDTSDGFEVFPRT